MQDAKLEISPNPFTTKTVIRGRIPDLRHETKDQRPKKSNVRGLKSMVSLMIYDLAGRLVKTFPIINSQSPVISIVWDGTDNCGRKLASGVYFCRVIARSPAVCGVNSVTKQSQDCFAIARNDSKKIYLVR